MNLQNRELSATLVIVLITIIGWSYLLFKLSIAFCYPRFV